MLKFVGLIFVKMMAVAAKVDNEPVDFMMLTNPGNLFHLEVLHVGRA